MNVSIKKFDLGRESTANVVINHIPDTCSLCHHACELKVIECYLNANGNLNYNDRRLQILVQCPRHDCKKYGIAYYTSTNSSLSDFRFEQTKPIEFLPESFADTIVEISPSFIKIYNQAKQAESNNLDEIAGVGYRKALEFLIKDYLIYKKPDNSDEIKKKPLGKCIEEDVSASNIKQISARAVWLGNDETHYTRVWTDQDITALKLLVKLTAHWIDSEQLTAKFIDDMPKVSK